MAPAKFVRGKATNKATAVVPLSRKGISTRSQNIQDQNIEPIVTRGKRKADCSPLKNDKVKRSALGNLTNNVTNLHLDDENKLLAANKGKQDNRVLKNNNNINNSTQVLKASNDNIQQKQQQQQQPQQQIFAPPAARASKIVTRAAAKNSTVPIVPAATATKSKDSLEAPKPVTRRISNEFEKTEDSLYMSALEDIPSPDSIRFSGNFDAKRRSQSQPEIRKPDSLLSVTIESDTSGSSRLSTASCSPIQKEIPVGVLDFDKENWNDPFQVSEYAMDIFNYLKQRELLFPIEDYMHKQMYLTKWMRSLLVDWMVEVQETFELNHETLYLAVKLVDIYLGKVIVMKDKLQLLGAAALFVSCKFDERTPPLVDDFLYICDGAYTQNELTKMEVNLLRTIDFDLGVPLSYRYLRRYARCAKVPMPTLTLARYILEFSLMDYATISYSDSKMACAVLFMALRMNGNKNAWDTTLEYYTDYKLEDFAFIVGLLNTGLHRKPKETIKTVRNKYSHKIFFEVAKTKLMTTESLFENTGLVEEKKIKD